MPTPRVLVCSVTSWNDRVGGDTYSALFEGYDQDRLANLYIREELPNSSVCSWYFKISESRVIRSVLNRSMLTGRELRGTQFVPDDADLAAEAETSARYEKYRRKRPWTLLYAREILWKLGRWRTPELDAFVDGFKPDVVLFPMESYIHFNRINRYIVRRSGARAIGYFYDDNFTYKQHPWSAGYRLYRFFQRRDLKRTARCCSAFFAISPKMKAECDAFFGIDSVLLTKPIDFDTSEWTPYRPGSPLRLLYTGNLLYGRLNTLYLVSDAINRVNRGEERVVLDVYSNTTLNDKELSKLDSAVHLHPSVRQGQVRTLQQQADALLFMEDVAGPDRNVARLSFSTKLTDYMAAGKAILAVAAKEVAPMEYLSSEDAALCATSTDEVIRQLERMIADPSLVSEYGWRADYCGRRNHDARSIRRRLVETIEVVSEATEGPFNLRRTDEIRTS